VLIITVLRYIPSLYRGAPLDTVFTAYSPSLNKTLKHSLLINLLNKPQLYMSDIEESVALFVRQMEVTKDDPIDISNWAFYWAFDLTHTLVIGGHSGYMAARADYNGMVYAFKTIVRAAAGLGQVPQWCSMTLANERLMSWCRSFKGFPDPTIQLLEENRPFEICCGTWN
jgi:hypothetical protein